MVGLQYYGGGEITYAAYPNTICATDSKQWIKDIESRTANNWTQTGKIELAKQYSIGAPRSLIVCTTDEFGYAWNKVKEEFLKVFTEIDSYDKWQSSLAQAKREPGETINQYHVHLYEILNKLKAEELDHTPASIRIMTSTFMQALPPNFKSFVTKEDRSQPIALFSKALSYIENNPQCKLRDQDVAKELKNTVNVVAKETRLQSGATPRRNFNPWQARP